MIGVFKHSFVVEVRHIDQLGHAGNFHYVEWMQHAAVAHSTANGWPPSRYQELGAGWVVRSHLITYLKPAIQADTVTIRTWVADMKAVTSLRRYQFTKASGDLLATAETNWAFVNYTRQKPIRIPSEVSASFDVLPGLGPD